MSRPPASDFVAACAVRTLARTETFMPMKPAAPDRIGADREPDRHRPRKQKPEGDEHDDADAGDGRVLAREIGLRPFATAPEISCIRAVPASAAIRLLIV